MWAQFSALMIAKVAEMLTLRRAFPQELSGLYSTEEMQQAEVINVTPEKPVSKIEQKTSAIDSQPYELKAQLANVLMRNGFVFDENGKKIANEWHEFCLTNKMTNQEMIQFVESKITRG
jgi:hypothetical protein